MKDLRGPETNTTRETAYPGKGLEKRRDQFRSFGSDINRNIISNVPWSPRVSP